MFAPRSLGTQYAHVRRCFDAYMFAPRLRPNKNFGECVLVRVCVYRIHTVKNPYTREKEKVGLFGGAIVLGEEVEGRVWGRRSFEQVGISSFSAAGEQVACGSSATQFLDCKNKFEVYAVSRKRVLACRCLYRFIIQYRFIIPKLVLWYRVDKLQESLTCVDVHGALGAERRSLRSRSAVRSARSAFSLDGTCLTTG